MRRVVSARIILILCVVLTCSSSAFCSALVFKEDSTLAMSREENPKDKRIRIGIGLGLLGAEYIGGPLLAQQVWWQNGFHWDNPLKYIGELEPFIEDDCWHFASCAMFTEFHYQVFTRCFKAKRPVLWSSLLTFVTWTGIESLDALDKKHGWLFSVNDEIANCLGISFWILKHRYPRLPVEVRVGFRKWGSVFGYVEKAFTALEDYEEYAGNHLDNYAILKVEAIYKFYDDYYAGISVSKKDGGSTENLFGVALGYDIVHRLNKERRGWWNQPVDLFRKYASLSLAFTFWLD